MADVQGQLDTQRCQMSNEPKIYIKTMAAEMDSLCRITGIGVGQSTTVPRKYINSESRHVFWGNPRTTSRIGVGRN